jgi:hypothetical protein
LGLYTPNLMSHFITNLRFYASHSINISNCCGVIREYSNLASQVFITLEARKNPGYRWSRDSQKIDCLEREGKVSYYMLPLRNFTLRSQGVSVLYRSTLRITYTSKYFLNFISVCLYRAVLFQDIFSVHQYV